MSTRRAISVTGYLVLGALTMITPLSTNLFVPSLPSIAAAFGAPIASVQASVSAALIGIAVGQLVIGSISDRTGRRAPALIGTTVFVLVSVLCMLSTSLPMLIALRFVQGFAGASGVVLARASIRDRLDGAEAAQGLSRLLIVAAIAPIVGPFLGALALNVMDWRGVFAVLAVMGLIAFGMSLRWFPETLHRDARSGAGAQIGREARQRMLRDPRFWAFVAVAGLLGLISFSWLSTSAFVFMRGYGLEPTGYGAILGLTSATFLTSAWVNSRRVMTIGARRALLQGLVVVAVGSTILCVGAVTHAPLWVLIVGSILGVGFYGGMIANAQAMAMARYGDAVGTASAFLGSAQFLLGAVLPPLITGLVGPEWSMGATMLVAALLSMLLAQFASRQHAPSPARVEVADSVG